MNSTQKSIQLSAKQLKTLGFKSLTEIPVKYWNEHISRCFGKFNSQQKNHRFLQNQTFNNFFEMDLTGANQEGTGRFPFNQIQYIKFSLIQTKSIGINHSGQNNALDLKSKKSKLTAKKVSKAKINNLKNNEEIEENPAKIRQKTKNLVVQSEFQFSTKAIEQILTAFLKIPTSYDPSINISIDPQTNNLVDENQMIEFQMQRNHKKSKTKAKINSRPIYDVWKLIDIGIEYKNKNIPFKNSKSKRSIHLFLIDADLVQNENQIDGRATGDGVAFVSFCVQDFSAIQLNNDFLAQTFPCYTIPILIHECLHTLGFDHCSGWECLMNSVTNEEVLLCPGCARKMDSEIGEKVSVKEWYAGMVRALEEVKGKMKEIYGAQKCIKMLANILYSKAEVIKIKQDNEDKKKEKTNLIEVKQGLETKNRDDSSFILNQKLSMLQKCLYIVKGL